MVGQYGEDEVAAGLRALVEAQAAVIARVNDGWSYVLPAADWEAKRGVYFRLQDGSGEFVAALLEHGTSEDEVMPPGEQIVVYGRVVRTDEAPDA